jgi:hypothetical protein
MHANYLTFSKDARGSRLYRVSPLLYPQEQLENALLLPKERDLPAHGLGTVFYPFDFGFNNPMATIAPYDTQYFGYVIGKDFLATAITGTAAAVGVTGANAPATAGQPGALPSPSYLFNFLQTHNGNQRQWANKNLTNLEGVGSASDPIIFRNPVLVPEGDTLTCEVQNLANVTLQVQILLTGGEF